MDILARLQADFTARLNSLAYFADIEVFALSAFPKGNTAGPQSVEALLDKIHQSLAGFGEKAGKMGACIIVPLPRLDGENPNVPGPQLRERLHVQILINPIINEDATLGTGKTLSEIALKVIQAGHHFQIEGVAGLVSGEDAFEPGVDEDKGLLTGICTFQTMLQLAQPTSVARPVVTVGGTVAMTCATSGASIYYTTNEAFPSPQEATATLYTTPFATPSAGTSIRAAAYKTGVNGSNVSLSVV